MRARQPQIPTPAEIKAPDPLRQAALHPARSAYWALNCGVSWRCRGRERLMVGLWADRELAGGCLGGSALPAGGTRTTGRPVKPDANDRVA